MMRLAQAVLLTAGFVTCAELAAQPIVEFSAHYQASANGIGATAERSLVRLDSGSYRLSNVLRASLAGLVIANLEQTSEFDMNGNSVVPLSYSYLLTGISSEASAISYNWDAAVAVSTEDDENWTIQLSDGVMDQLSYQFVLRRELQNDAGTELEFKLIDEDEIELHRYRVLGDEILDTPLGALNSVRIERVRDRADGRSTTIWLARDWHYLLAKIEQVNGSGLRIKLELESAVVDGTEVEALP